MNYSLTYLAVIALAALGIENAEEVVNAIVIVLIAVAGLYGRYRAGGLTIFGVRSE